MADNNQLHRVMGPRPKSHNLQQTSKMPGKSSHSRNSNDYYSISMANGTWYCRRGARLRARYGEGGQLTAEKVQDRRVQRSPAASEYVPTRPRWIYPLTGW